MAGKKKTKRKTKVSKKARTRATSTATVLTAKIAVANQPADIVLTNTRVTIQGATIKILGSQNNTLATFDSRSAKFTVHGKLMVGKTDVMAKLEALEARINEI